MVEFIVGLIGNIIASYIYDTAIRKPDAKSPPLIFIVQPSTPQPTSTRHPTAVKIDQRAINRAQAERTLASLFFFGVTLVFLKYAVYLPILLGHFTNDMLDFSKVKLISWFTNTTVPMSSVNTATTVFAVLIYTPLLILGDKLLIVVQGWYDRFWEINFNKWLVLRIGTFLFLSLLASGIVTYFVTTLSFLQSLAAPFIALIILFALGANNSQR